MIQEIKAYFAYKKLKGGIMNRDKQATISGLVTLLGVILSFFHVDIYAVQVIDGQSISIANAIALIGGVIFTWVTNKSEKK